MKMKFKLFYFLTILYVYFGFSQKGEITNFIYEGNKNTENEAFIEAEKSYRKALSLSPQKGEALYNLGNTHFLEEQYDEASQRFFQTQKFATNKEIKHQAFHNMGNVFMQKKEYQKALEAYKNALRNNPADDETRYNYAIAKELLENEKPPEEQEQNDQKENEDQKDQQEKDQNKNQEGDQENKDENDPEKEGDDGDQNKDEGEPKNEGDKNNDKKENQKKEKPQDEKQVPKRGQLSPEQVQSLLEAMNNQEKEVQDKVNAKKLKGTPVRGRKDW